MRRTATPRLEVSAPETFKRLADVLALFPARRVGDELRELHGDLRSLLLLEGRSVDPPVPRAPDVVAVVEPATIEAWRAEGERPRLLRQSNMVRYGPKRCSHCRKLGHNRQTCGALNAGSPKPLIHA